MKAQFIEAARAKTGQRVAIRISEVATVSECAGLTSCVVTKKGEAYHISHSYDEAVKEAGIRGETSEAEAG